jgi:hypothetical protein
MVSIGRRKRGREPVPLLCNKGLMIKAKASIFTHLRARPCWLPMTVATRTRQSLRQTPKLAALSLAPTPTSQARKKHRRTGMTIPPEPLIAPSASSGPQWGGPAVAVEVKAGTTTTTRMQTVLAHRRSPGGGTKDGAVTTSSRLSRSRSVSTLVSVDASGPTTRSSLRSSASAGQATAARLRPRNSLTFQLTLQ